MEEMAVAEVRFESNRATVEMRVADESKVRMERALELVRGEAMRLMSERKSGRIYRVPGTKVLYTASAPGEAPAVPTGRLKGSITRDVTVTLTETIGRVGTGLPYGAHLEYGTRRIRPRPWLTPSFRNMRERIASTLGGRWW